MSFNFKSIEHALGAVGHEIVIVSKKIVEVIGKASAAEATIEALTGLVSPQAVIVERAAFTALGLVSKAAQDAGDAAAANGLNIALDAQTIADFKAIYVYLAEELAKRGIDPKSLAK